MDFPQRQVFDSAWSETVVFSILINTYLKLTNPIIIIFHIYLLLFLLIFPNHLLLLKFLLLFSFLLKKQMILKLFAIWRSKARKEITFGFLDEQHRYDRNGTSWVVGSAGGFGGWSVLFNIAFRAAFVTSFISSFVADLALFAAFFVTFIIVASGNFVFESTHSFCKYFVEILPPSIFFSLIKLIFGNDPLI